MSDNFSHGSFQGGIVETGHGPEITLTNYATEIARMTVGEFETLLDDMREVA